MTDKYIGKPVAETLLAIVSMNIKKLKEKGASKSKKKKKKVIKVGIEPRMVKSLQLEN